MTSTAQTGLGVPSLEWVMSIQVAIATEAVSYTHLTLPTNREV